jgi:hypothetical protein
MKILLVDFNAKIVREDIFKPTIGNKNLHEISNDNGVRLVNLDGSWGRWYHIIVLTVHDPTEDKTDGVKDSFYEELERVIDKFPKYNMKILLGDFNAKIGREDILNR